MEGQAFREGLRVIWGDPVPAKAALNETRSCFRILRNHKKALLVVFGAFLLAGCDKCGNPAKLNLPDMPKACYDNSQPQT